MASATAGVSARDRDATERRILEAARDLLVEEGASGIGINAVARRAGCDKQLIYRYYGGLDGLMAALGAALASWWTERLRPEPGEERPRTYAALIRQLAARLLSALRTDPLMRRIAGLELAGSDGNLAPLSEARTRAMMAWMAEMRGDLVAPSGLDAPAVNALLIAAIHHLAAAGETTGLFAGLAIATDADWDRVTKALDSMIEAVYGTP
jgi:AcrR family transcriptional regulator